MRTWDLTTGAKKLELALKTLNTTSAEVKQYWSDEANRKFQETYISPVEPKLRNLLDAIQRLSDVLASAEQQCGTNKGF